MVSVVFSLANCDERLCLHAKSDKKFSEFGDLKSWTSQIQPFLVALLLTLSGTDLIKQALGLGGRRQGNVKEFICPHGTTDLKTFKTLQHHKIKVLPKKCPKVNNSQEKSAQGLK